MLEILCFIDRLAILQMGLDRPIVLYIFIRVVRWNGVGAFIIAVHIRKFF